MISIVNNHFLAVGILIPGHRPNDYLLTLQLFIPREMKCRQHQSIIASQDMQSHIGDKLITINRYIGAQSTELTYTNQPLLRQHCLGPGRIGLTFRIS